MFKFIMLAIFIVPTLEVALFMIAGKTIGILGTLAIILITGILGGYLAKTQGMNAFRELQLKLRRGEMPGDTLLDGALILAGGILLITPGFFTDFVGFCLLLPIVRQKVKEMMAKYLKNKMTGHTVVYTYRR